MPSEDGVLASVNHRFPTSKGGPSHQIQHSSKNQSMTLHPSALESTSVRVCLSIPTGSLGTPGGKARLGNF